MPLSIDPTDNFVKFLSSKRKNDAVNAKPKFTPHPEVKGHIKRNSKHKHK